MRICSGDGAAGRSFILLPAVSWKRRSGRVRGRRGSFSTALQEEVTITTGQTDASQQGAVEGSRRALGHRKR